MLSEPNQRIMTDFDVMVSYLGQMVTKKGYKMLSVILLKPKVNQ